MALVKKNSRKSFKLSKPTVTDDEKRTISNLVGHTRDSAKEAQKTPAYDNIPGVQGNKRNTSEDTKKN